VSRSHWAVCVNITVLLMHHKLTVLTGAGPDHRGNDRCGARMQTLQRTTALSYLSPDLSPEIYKGDKLAYGECTVQYIT
ncbi:hypothetical protein BJV78DRAFT_1215612, partial [Lactifluus subvellereus]